jgi:hypothetical protein
MRSRLFPLLIAAFLCVLAGSAQAARPGGGGSYHGSSGSSSGGSSGGGFSSSGVTSHGGGGVALGPVGTLILLGVIAGVVVLVLISQRRARNGPRTEQYDAYAAQRQSASLGPLQARDPQLTEQSIVEHVRPMADQLRNAWCNGDMRPARPFVSDGVYSRFQVQLELMRQENRRNVMGDAQVLTTSIDAVEDAAPLDVVHVRLTAQARDTEVPWGASGEQVQAAIAATPVVPYTEIWTLVRRSGAQTKPGGFQVGRACPGCGAPLEGGETIKCRYCGALVCSGEHDWVLGEITQLEEWRPTGARPPGVDDLRARDPGLAAEVLEDRASYLFWKWVQAGRAGQTAPLRKCATAAFVSGAGGATWARQASDIAVGAAEVVQCAVAAGDGFDHVDVLVKWSARFNAGAEPTPRRTVLRLARRTGVQSKPSMTALVCAACGAPMVESESSKCDHCGAELAAGDQAWVLEAVVPA